jgi:hypothetical protein
VTEEELRDGAGFSETKQKKSVVATLPEMGLLALKAFA